MLDDSDCFDKAAVLFDSSFSVWEFPGPINALIVCDRFLSLQMLFLSFSLFSYQFFLFTRV